MIIKAKRDDFWILNWLDQFMVGHKGFIAGGCFKNIFNRENVKDLDIFFNNENDFNEAVNHFNNMTSEHERENKQIEDYSFHYENDNVVAYRHKKTGIVIELCRKVFGTAEEIVGKFDFTITKFAYYKAIVSNEETSVDAVFDEQDTSFDESKNHIEYQILYDDKFFEHLHLKRLVTDDKILYPMNTFERMFRYAKYGYFPCMETKMKVAKQINQLNGDQIQVSEGLYDGVD